jgi:Cu2+-containing amine oxidase
MFAVRLDGRCANLRPFHQHFLIAKLDLDIDGDENTVIEVDSVAEPRRWRTL